MQRNLLLSYAMGVGENLPQDVVRAMLLLRAQSLALEHSGVRPEVVELLLEMPNRGFTLWFLPRARWGPAGTWRP